MRLAVSLIRQSITNASEPSEFTYSKWVGRLIRINGEPRDVCHFAVPRCEIDK